MMMVVKRRQVLSIGIGALAMILLAVLLSLARCSHLAATSAAKMGTDWGLSFGAEGQQPTGNATKEELRQHNAYYIGGGQEKVIYLTFDAGYENGYTASILDTLKKHEVQAAFFLVGHYVKTQPDLVKRMVAEGHVVGNHTMTHPNLASISDKTAFAKELTDLESLYEGVIGAPMAKFYRPPQGKYLPANLDQASELGYTTIFWSLAYADWDVNNQPSRETALEKLTGRIHPGAVVLLHSTSATNAQVLDELIGKWKEMGYTFGNLFSLCAPAQG
nr:polysaccharide deacetylase family protein [bacterium]